MTLETFGWSAYFEALFAEHAAEGLTPGRVVAEHRGAYRVWTTEGERAAELAGRLRHEAGERGDLPAVGDWVACRARPDGGATVHALLPRRGAFSRKVAGAKAEEQVVAANVDTVFLVTGLDGDFNLRRVERYLAVAWESGASPVVVLNKSDLSDDLAARVAEVERVALGAPVVALSATAGDGVEALAEWLRPGETVALLGSSGVGKSTIVNRLKGEPAQRTGEVREHDSRGRHTTTHRELLLLDSGAILVDTPGMRELQLWSDGDGLRDAFGDVAEVAGGCRFADCRHEGEPGCAVAAAIEAGELDEARLASYRGLERELAHLARRRDQRLRLAEKQRWKAIHKAMRGADKRR